MAALSGLPPATLKDVLEAHGWSAIDETDHNWVMVDGASGEPITIPKHGAIVTPDVMDSVSHRTGLAGPILKAVQRHVATVP